MFAAIIAVSLVVHTDPPKGKEKELTEPAKKELQKLEGKWKIAKLAGQGMEHTLTESDTELVVEIKERQWRLNGQLKGELVSVDPTSDPPCLDMKSLEKGKNGVVEEAIYKLDGDTLTMAWYQGQGKNRPTTFNVPKEKGTVLVVMNRVKEEPKKNK